MRGHDITSHHVALTLAPHRIGNGGRLEVCALRSVLHPLPCLALPCSASFLGAVTVAVTVAVSKSQAKPSRAKPSRVERHPFPSQLDSIRFDSGRFSSVQFIVKWVSASAPLPTYPQRAHEGVTVL